MAAGPSSWQQNGARGNKLLSAYPRALIDIGLNNATLIDLPPGLTSTGLVIPGALVKSVAGTAANPYWALRRNLIYKFSAGLIIFANNPNVISLESCGMTVTLLNPANGGGPGTMLVKAASLGSLTALANANPISIDEWEIDCNDCIALQPSSSGLPAANKYSEFLLQIFLNTNNTGAVHQNITISGAAKALAAQFDSYRFDTWD